MRIKTKYELRGLLQCLRAFDYNGRYAQNGKWEIGNGGYDLNWELSYERIPIVGCIGRHIELYRDDRSNAKAVIKRILSVYSDLKYKETN